MGLMKYETLECDIDILLEAAWKDAHPHVYPGRDSSEFQILVARPDSWIAIKAMGVVDKGVIYYAQIVDGKKRRAHKLFEGKESLIKKFRQLKNKPGGMTFAEVTE